MSSELRGLVVGAGARVREVLAPALIAAKVPIRVEGVVDPAVDVADGLGLGPVPAYESLDEALGFQTYDVALVACPHDLHQSTALRLLDAGVAVWKEKPFALTIEDAHALANRAGSLRVLAHRPHGQLFAMAERMLPSWGRLLSYRVHTTRPTGDYSATWRALRDRSGGGALLDLGYHAADAITRLVPSPVTSVYALSPTTPAWRPHVEVEESAHVLLAHSDGVRGTMYLSRHDDRQDMIDLVAEHGRITITDSHARISVHAPGGLEHTMSVQAADHPWAQMLRFHTNSLGDTSVDRSEARIGVLSVSLIQAAYTSLRSGSPEPLPAVTTHMEGAA